MIPSSSLIFLKPFEQSAKTNLNVEQVFFSIARDIKQRLAETDSKAEVKFVFLHLQWDVDWYLRLSVTYDSVYAAPGYQDQ